MNRNEQPNLETRPVEGYINTEHEEHRRSFMARMRNKLMAMTLAGFITLGGSWEKSYAEQLKVIKNKNEAPKFLLESAINPDKLKTFEEKLKNEEPEFIEWLLEYSKTVSGRLDDLTDKILNFQENQDTDQIFATDDGALPGSIYKDHQALENIKKESRKLQEYQQFLKDNIYNIVISAAFLDNSKAVRNNMVKLVDPPNFIFTLHGQNQYAFTSPLPRDQYGHYIKTGKNTKWKPEITFTSEAYKEELDFNLYVNVFIHELIHALHPGARNLANPSAKTSGLTSILEEGLTQNLTLEVVQELSMRNTKLKPGVSLVDYDERVVWAAILEGISRSKENNDSLSRWHTRIIDDSELIIRPVAY